MAACGQLAGPPRTRTTSPLFSPDEQRNAEKRAGHDHLGAETRVAKEENGIGGGGVTFTYQKNDASVPERTVPLKHPTHRVGDSQ